VVEILFGVPNHLGMNTDQATRMIADVLKRGLLRS
jgi:hypothetical protein